MNDLNKNAPVVIGGVGGSGTRLFASILKESDFYIGNLYNKPLDNVWFSRLIIPQLNKIVKSPVFLRNTFSIFKIIMTSDQTISFKNFESAIKKIGEKRASYLNIKRIYQKQ